jgi:hypothetical protein
MKVSVWLGFFALILSACGPTPQWVKPGATEADLRNAMTLCDRENMHFGRGRITSMGTEPAEDVVAHRPSNYRRGGGEMAREQCLERHGWTLESVQ